MWPTTRSSAATTAASAGASTSRSLGCKLDVPARPGSGRPSGRDPGSCGQIRPPQCRTRPGRSRRVAGTASGDHGAFVRNRDYSASSFSIFRDQESGREMEGAGLRSCSTPKKPHNHAGLRKDGQMAATAIGSREVTEHGRHSATSLSCGHGVTRELRSSKRQGSVRSTG